MRLQARNPAERLGDPETAADVVARAYARWGVECFTHLRGEFAVAIWDSAQQVLVCARDPLGVMPLYVVHRPRELYAFSTDLRALVELMGPGLVSDHERTVRFLACLTAPPQRTFFRDIRLLPAGHWLRLSRAVAEQRQYWSPSTRTAAMPSTEPEWILSYQAALTKAVAERMPPTDAVASELSGGLDSSSVTATAVGIARRQPNGLSILALTTAFPGFPELDESHYAKATADALGVEHVLMPVKPTAHCLARLFADLFEPDGFDWLGIEEASRRVARQRGCSRLLTGYLGDLFGGYERGQLVAELLHSGSIAAAWREALGAAKGPRGAVLALVAAVPPGRALARRRRFARSQRWAVERSQFLRDTIASRHDLRGAIQDRSGLDATVHLDPSLDLWQQLNPGLLDLGACLHHRRSVASGVLAVHPFLDQRIVELVAALPWRLRRRNGLSRFILREAVKGQLPESVRLRRDKARFAGFYEAGYLHTIRNEVLPSARTWFEPVEDLVDVPRVLRALQTLSPGNLDRSLALWHAVTLAYWLRHAPNLQR